MVEKLHLLGDTASYNLLVYLPSSSQSLRSGCSAAQTITHCWSVAKTHIGRVVFLCFGQVTVQKSSTIVKGRLDSVVDLFSPFLLLRDALRVCRRSGMISLGK